MSASTFVGATIPVGTYEHAIGKLTVSRSERYIVFSLRFREPIGPAAACEWFFNLDGTFDGTGTELADPVIADHAHVGHAS